MQLLSTTKAVDPNLVLFLRPTSANLFPWCQEFLLDTLLSSDHCPHQRLQMPVSTTTSKPHASSRTLRPSTSGNMERTHVVDKTTRYFDPPSHHRDENLRPSSPVGATLGTYLSSLDQDVALIVRTQQKSCRVLEPKSLAVFLPRICVDQTASLYSVYASPIPTCLLL